MVNWSDRGDRSGDRKPKQDTNTTNTTAGKARPAPTEREAATSAATKQGRHTR